MRGVRLADGEMRSEGAFRPGAYGRVLRDEEWIWMACTPNGYLGDLSEHEVTEHEDGSISVEPSIDVGMDGRSLWHGYLRRGKWETC